MAEKRVKETDHLLQSNLLLAGGENHVNSSSYSVDDVLDLMGHGKMQNIILCVCGLLFASDGLEVLLISIVAPLLQCEWYTSSLAVAWISGGATLGMFFGSPVFGYFSDMYGRKSTLILASAMSSFLSVLCSFAPSFGWMVFLRIIMGLCLSAYTQLIPFVVETLPNRTKARVTFIHFMWSVSGVTCTIVSYFSLKYLNWRWLILLLSIPSWISCLLFSMLPESPRYYAASKEPEKLIKALQTYSKVNKVPLPTGHLAIPSSPSLVKGKIRDLINKRFIRRSIAFFTMHFSVGLLYYGIVFLAVQNLEDLLINGTETSVHETVKCKSCTQLTTKTFKTIFLSNIAELFAGPSSFLLINNIGGKRAFYTCSILITALYSTMLFPGYLYIVRLSILRLLINSTVITCQAITPMYFPTRIRGVAMGMSNVANRTGGFIAPFLAQVLVKSNTRLTVVVFISFVILSGFVTILLDRSIEDKSNKE